MSLLDDVSSNLGSGSVIVIKFGGHAMENEEARINFCEDIDSLCKIGMKPIIVHGGGPMIKQTLADLNIESQFINGLRVTDPKTMEVAQMVLCGSVNKDIVRRLSNLPNIRGALGLSGLDSKIIQAKVKDPSLGLVGEPVSVNTQLINDLIGLDIIPVIAPVGSDEVQHIALNCNADTAAGAVAESLKADHFLLLTDIVGVLDKEKNLIENLPIGKFQSLIDDGTIQGGMIPKIETAVQAVKRGCGVVSITDGREKNCVLKALSMDIKQFGTKITP